MIYRGLATLILIAMVVGAVLLGQQHFRSRGALTTPPNRAEPGYAAHDAELIETGADGLPLYRLNAQVIRQHPESGTVQLDGVHMSYRGENSNQWALTAEHGSVRENDRHIELSGNVRATGILPGSSELAQIRTEQLSFDIQSEIASTREPVILQWGSRELTGVGLVANLKERQVRLESKVHGRFTP